tara:strand:+ start:290 stop:409 length:120 start_codon:yes stop_codon:yes gene_type:complete
LQLIIIIIASISYATLEEYILIDIDGQILAIEGNENSGI